MYHKTPKIRMFVTLLPIYKKKQEDMLTDLNFIKGTANSWTSPLPHKTELVSSFFHTTMDSD